MKVTARTKHVSAVAGPVSVSGVKVKTKTKTKTNAVARQHTRTRSRSRSRSSARSKSKSKSRVVLVHATPEPQEQEEKGQEGEGKGVPYQDESVEKTKWQSLRFIRTVFFFAGAKPIKQVVTLPLKLVTLPVKLVKKIITGGGAKGKGKETKGMGRSGSKSKSGRGQGQQKNVVQVFNNRKDNDDAEDEGVYLVAGATGGVGKRCVTKLLSKGLRVRALVRDVEKATDLLSTGPHTEVPGAVLELVAGDITQPATLLPEFFFGVKGVVCATACKVVPKEGDTPDRKKYYQGIKFFDPEIVGDTPEVVDYLGVKHLVDAVKETLGDGTKGKAILPPEKEEESSARASHPPLQWGALDDVVMGGVSESGMETDALVDGIPCALFKGVVRTERNGGFASMRTKNLDPPLNLGAYDELRLRVKGNGQRFKLMIRTSAGFDVVGYSKSFDTEADTWQDISLPFEDFVPVFRAKTLSPEEAEPLDPSKVVSLQIMLSKFEYDGELNPSFKPGDFELAIGEIKAVMKEEPAPRFVYVSSAGVTRPNRPGIDVEVEPPAVKLNDTLGGILTYKLKGEDVVRDSGIPFCIVRPCALTEEPEGAPLVVDQGDTIKGKVSREDVASLCCSLFSLPDATDTTFEIKSTVPFSEPFVQPETFEERTIEDWSGLLVGAQVNTGVTGKTINGVYTGKEKEADVVKVEVV